MVTSARDGEDQLKLGTVEFCDLVMKGGITSGLVYPNAVLELSTRFRFKNIGGTSAGAIAAAACAAAALGERRKELDPNSLVSTNTEEAGFEGLTVMAAWLTRPGSIYSLFQPVSGASALFRLVVALSGGSGIAAKLLAILLAILSVAGAEFLLVLVAFAAFGFYVGGAAGALAVTPATLICALLIAGASAMLRVARVVRKNHIGICSGMGRRQWGREMQPALTEWLHEQIQKLAGQAPDEPLLFEHLWAANRYPNEPPTPRALTLRMITTSVSHHEPRSLPLESGNFWFLRNEFAALFPASVVDWMVAQDPHPIVSEGRTYYELPKGGRLPIIVATRMSLSFPLLISAVPLYEPDYRFANLAGERALKKTEIRKSPGSALNSLDALTLGGARDGLRPEAGDAPFRVCWFSDGGISSNFPVHLFDAPLPRWPTFAIDLVYPTTEETVREGIFLPAADNQVWPGHYETIARPSALGEIAAFLFGIVSTMQNWRDLLLSRAPGQRERIVRVSLSRPEGGMNLDMPEHVLLSVSDKGRRAGLKLNDEFRFDHHWWVRWRNVAGASERFLKDFAVGAKPPPLSDSYADAYASATTGNPPPPSHPFTIAQQEVAQVRFVSMLKQGEEAAASPVDLSKGAPSPMPRMGIVPIY